MDSSWEQSIAWVLVSEKGNDDDPDDPGGRTSDGIEQTEYNVYRAHHGLTHQDVFKASMAEKKDIYKTSYWMPYCPTLPPGLDYIFFDEFVNTGLHEAVILLQQSVGAAADGHIGVVTSAAIAKCYDSGGVPAAIRAYSAGRIAYYKRLRGFWKYGKGWLNRVYFAQANALKLAAQPTAPKPGEA
jgi:lysozyme family protein